ncbi:MAG: hypothetical protein AB1689_26925 [Thermodesulfobacteriota bacterium]
MAAARATALLAVAGGDAPGLVHAKVDGLRRFLLAYGAARSWLWLALDPGTLPSGPLAVSAILLTGCAALAWSARHAALAARLALAVLVVQLAWTFPLTHNHFFLELVAVALLALVDRDGDGETVALEALCWVTALVLLHTGLAKVLHGLYFRGELLAFLVGRGGRFADLFAWLLPADEIARLASYDPMRSGAGPYRVASVPFVVASNLVWMLEMALAPLLLWRRTRPAAAVAAIALVLAIQLGARELGFALLFTNLLLLFVPAAATRTLLPVLGALLLWMIVAAFGWLPGREWLLTGNV